MIKWILQWFLLHHFAASHTAASQTVIIWQVGRKKLSLGGHQSCSSTSEMAENICWRQQRVPWWDTMQMVLDKTSECDDWEAWESMIMGLLHHAEPWPALLLLWGCFTKQTARGGAYWALLSYFLSTKHDAVSTLKCTRGGLGLSILGCCCCSSGTFI